MPIIVNPDIGIQQNTTGASRIPVGTTGERPSSPTNGQIRFNTTLNEFEAYDGTDWVVFAAPGSATAAANSLVRSDSQGKIDRDYLPSVDQPVYYVSKDGEDSSDRTGQAENDAWFTIRFALEQITGPATLYVKSGVYEETLPLTVPAEVAVIGDNQRTTEVKPAAGLGDNSIPNINQTMWRVNNGAMLTNMVFSGLTGFTVGNTPDDPSGYTVQGVYVALDPNNPITTKSPYIFDCAAFSSGAIGAYADGSIHQSGNKSMLLHAYTVIIDDGVAFWAKDNGRMEIVSGFSYYNHVGYLATGGGTIRSLNGNCSYGTYGALSDGFDASENTVTGAVYGEQIEYDPDTLVGEFTDGTTITGATSGATGTVTNAQTSADKVYYLSTSTAEFQAGEIISDGLGNSATVVAGGVTGQKGFVIVADGFDSLPEPGASIQFAGDPSSYVISTVSGSYVDSESVIILVLAGEKTAASLDDTAITIRRRFSQVRLTGHDFLSIGTGNRTQTNYPDADFYPPIQGNEVVENRPGRVYYVSTDQDGNFRVGDYFRVDQATGRATLDASAFDLSGLTSLRLGSIGAQVGELINEFSSDVTMSGNSNEAVPTEFAVRSYFSQVATDLVPNADNTLTLGTPENRWQEVYVGPGSVQIGTVKLSDVSGNFSVSTEAGLPTTLEADTFDTGSITLSQNNITGTNSNEDLEVTASGTGVVRFNSAIEIAGDRLYGPSTFIIDPATHDDDTGTLVVAGNLQVDGTTTTINSTTLEVDDKNVVLAKGAADATAADGAGITVEGANAELTYRESGDNWEFNKDLDVVGNISVSGTIDGRDVASDGSKLDGVESNADVTDATNVQSSGALMDSELTNESAVKNIDQELTTTSSVDFGGLDVDSGTLFVDSANNRVNLKTTRINGNLLFDNEDSLISTTSENFINLRSDNFGSNVTINSSGYFSANDFVFGARSNSSGSGKFFFGNGAQTTDDAAWKNTLTVDTNGDISFYEDTGTTPKFFWDASAERLGIGTDSPIAALHVNSTEDFETIVLSEGDGGIARVGIGWEKDGTFKRILRVFDDGTSDNMQIGDGLTGPVIYKSGDSHRFNVEGSEAARIDSSGRLLVGTTSSFPPSDSGNEGVAIRPESIAISRDNSAGLIVDRMGNDGDIVEFRKDGSTVGSIGNQSSFTFEVLSSLDNIVIGAPTRGIVVNTNADNIRPFNPSNDASLDDTIDLGANNARFKDLYLSGGVYLGGTGSDNYLDDYEEGTWTPTNDNDSTGTINFSAGRYTKTGSIVVVHGTVQVGTGFSGTTFGGLPFVANQPNVGSSVHGLFSVRSNGDDRYFQLNANSTDLIVRSSPAGSSAVSPQPSDSTFRFSIVYQTDS